MGKNHSKHPPVTQGHIEITTYRAYLNIETEMNKRISQLKNHEKSILEVLNTGIYTPESVRVKAIASINHLKFIEGCKMLCNYLQQLKENSNVICAAQKEIVLIEQFRGMINSVVWSYNVLGLVAIGAFNKMISEQFSHKIIDDAYAGKQVDRNVSFKPFLTIFFRNLSEF